MDNGKYLVIFQLHMSAYGNSDKIRKGQIRMLSADMKKEYEAGNYVLCGGDFNHDLKAAEDDDSTDRESWHIHSQEICFQNIFLSVWINCQRKKSGGIVHEMQI